MEITDINKSDDQLISDVIAWAEECSDVRVVIWNSSLAKRCADPNAELHDIIDDFSDYDIALVVEDILPFYNSREWLSRFRVCPGAVS